MHFVLFGEIVRKISLIVMYSEVAKQFHWVGEVIWSILQAHRDHSTNLGNNDCNLKQKALLSLSSDGSDIVCFFFFNSNPIPSSVKL